MTKIISVFMKGRKIGAFALEIGMEDKVIRPLAHLKSTQTGSDFRKEWPAMRDKYLGEDGYLVLNGFTAPSNTSAENKLINPASEALQGDAPCLIVRNFPEAVLEVIFGGALATGRFAPEGFKPWPRIKAEIGREGEELSAKSLALMQGVQELLNPSDIARPMLQFRMKPMTEKQSKWFNGSLPLD